MKPFTLAATLFSAILLIVSGCGTGDPVAAGSGSTTTNGFTVAIVRTDGKPVGSAAVRMRTDDYISGSVSDSAAVDGIRMIDTVTGEDGIVTCNGIAPGSYTIEIIDAEHDNGALIRRDVTADSINDYGVVTVESLGEVQGAVSTDQLTGSGDVTVKVYGLERAVAVDRETGSFTVSGLPPADYRFRLSSDDPVFEPVEVFADVTVPPGATVYVNRFAQWLHSARITVTPADAGLDAGDTIVDFPLAVHLDDRNFNFSTAKKKGEDLRITKENGETVHFEIEWWDSTGQTAALWLLCDTLNGNLSAQTWNMYWGKGNAASVSQSSAVFDTTFGYRGVWHLNESGGTPQSDATVYGNDGTPAGMDGANDVAGRVGRAQQFKGDSQKITIENVVVPSDEFSLSLWVFIASFPDSVQGVLSGSDAFGTLTLDSIGQWRYSPADGAVELGGAATQGAWNNICVVRKNGYSYLYDNGTLVDSTDGEIPVADAVVNGTVYIGSGNASSGWFNGIIDEVRIYGTAVSDARIRADYETQRTEQSILTIEENE